MRSYPKLMAAALTLAAAVGSVVASSAAAQGTSGDLVAGSGLNGFPTPTSPGSDRLSVEGARSGPAGENPSGFVNDFGSLVTPMGAFAFEVEGPVTCLRVEGNKAAIKYRFAKASGFAEPFKGGGVEVFIEPRANASFGAQTAAEFNPSATHCDDPNMVTFSPLRSGAYTVIDRD